MEKDEEKTDDYPDYYGCVIMIVDERIVTFINSMETENSRILENIEREALDARVPIIRKEMQSFLKVLLLVKRPMRVLEVGTAVGFSALLMSEYLPESAVITTIENYEKRIPIARENFRRAGKEAQITLLEGGAQDVLKTLDEPYDFIFMDAAKGQYIHFLPDVLRLLVPGGLLVSDNVMQDGSIIESRFCVERQDRTIQCKDAGIFIRTETQSAAGNIHRSAWRRRGAECESRKRKEKYSGKYTGKETDMSEAKQRRHPELLIPASSLEVLKTAVIFGADAVYIGGEAFGLRAKAKNFSMDDMKERIAFAHEYGVKVYVTANILAHNDDLEGVRTYFEELKEIKPDALIIADPGVFEIAKEVCPENRASHQHAGEQYELRYI